MTRDLSKIQEEVHEWVKINFPGTVDNPWAQILGMQEELGELSHAELKKKQAIRHTPEECDEMAKDAVGDIMVFTMAYCNAKGWNLQKIIEDTWFEVLKRDWVAFRKENGLEEL